MQSIKKPLNKFKIIDFHTHIFPNELAQKATDNVGNYYDLPMFGNGTKESLVFGKKELNITNFVISSAVLNPLKTRAVNNFIYETSKENKIFIGLGSIHRDTENVFSEIDFIIEKGLCGIKLHPDFQGFNIDDEKMFPIYEYVEGKLPILFHVGDQKSDMSSPKRLAKVMKKFPNLIVVAAHMGGYTTLDLAKEYLLGTNAYFDTSNALRFMSKEDLVAMIRQHGSKKIFFGSDFPLLFSADAAKEFYEIDLTEKEFEDIFYNNVINFLKK